MMFVLKQNDDNDSIKLRKEVDEGKMMTYPSQTMLRLPPSPLLLMPDTGSCPTKNGSVSLICIVRPWAEMKNRVFRGSFFHQSILFVTAYLLDKDRTDHKQGDQNQGMRFTIVLIPDNDENGV
jgi:hypothetical protein